MGRQLGDDLRHVAVLHPQGLALGPRAGGISRPAQRLHEVQAPRQEVRIAGRDALPQRELLLGDEGSDQDQVAVVFREVVEFHVDGIHA